MDITASIIAVGTLAYQSCKSLNDFIGSFRNAPATLQALRSDLQVFQNLIELLQTSLARVGDVDLTAEQLSCLEALESAIKSCQIACGHFADKLAKATSRSDDGHVSFLDRARLHFGEKDTLLLKSRLGDCKETLDFALAIVTLNTTKRSQETLHGLETQIATAMSTFTGKLDGLELAVQSLSVSGVVVGGRDVAAVVGLLNEQKTLLRHCLRVCTSAFTETSRATRTTVKYARSYDEAIQWLGDIGDVNNHRPNINVDCAEARHKSRQGFGKMSVEAAREFFR